MCGKTNDRSRCALRVVIDGLYKLDEHLGAHGRMFGINEDPVEAECCRNLAAEMPATPLAVPTIVLHVRHKEMIASGRTLDSTKSWLRLRTFRNLIGWSRLLVRYSSMLMSHLGGTMIPKKAAKCREPRAGLGAIDMGREQRIGLGIDRGSWVARVELIIES